MTLLVSQQTDRQFATFSAFSDLYGYENLLILAPLVEAISHTGQCKRTGGCYNELVVAFFSTGGGVKDTKSIPVDFMIYL